MVPIATATAPTPRNHLLGALPEKEYRQLMSRMTPVKMRRDEVIYKAEEPIKYVYFPENAIISTVASFKDGTSIETGIIGREGMTGMSVALSKDAEPRETTVQSGGDGWRMSANDFRQAFEEGGALHGAVLHYVFAFFEQVALTGACGHHHVVNKRLARWLLMCHDRSEGDRLDITQDFMAQMLGVHRPGVTLAAINLKNEGLIDYRRGSLTILDRRGLEQTSCECYQSIRKIYDRYAALLEIKQLNQKLEAANARFAEVVEQRKRIQGVTHQRVQRLREVVIDSTGGRKSFMICARCENVKQQNGEWRQAAESVLEKLRKDVLPSVVCPICRSLDELPAAESFENRRRAGRGR